MVPLSISQTVVAAQAGDLGAYAALVDATQGMAYAAARRVLRSEADARDATQEAYLVAFRRLAELAEPESFAGWLRRIVLNTALNQRRRARALWVPLDEPGSPPVLDEAEQRWTEEQQRALSRALLTLSSAERRLCEFYYYAGQSAEQLAESAGVEPSAMRKRLQRIRDRLRKEIEMDEKRVLGSESLPTDLPASIVELLARPRLVEMPDNPVAAALATLSGAFAGFASIELPEEVDLEQAEQKLGGDAVYIDRSKLQRIAGERVLRYDLSLPLLLNVRFEGKPLRLTASGKVYRREEVSATHLEAFHQLEVFVIDDAASAESWSFAGRVLDSVDRLLPRSEVRVTPTEYPMCARAWSLDVNRQGEWVEVLAWGKYADWVLRALGADPARHAAYGAGYGLERNAGLRYGIDDIRKMAMARVA
ncbi:MAG TPA: sigma-70 family RNA polymerase sigma factor [Polyangiaceae bacterium]|jgi:RNA polymerase sigma-70 factor (ECF subfamily)